MDFIAEWREKGLLRPEQAELLGRVETGRLFSIDGELKAVLYGGALLIVGGIGATVKDHLLELGPLTISGALALAVFACLSYCYKLAAPYSPEKVESPTHAFDYILYIGCGLIGILFTYLESQFHLLAEHWDYYLLASAAFFFYLAYRMDNRLVLATALVNLASWFGVRFSQWDLPFFGLRVRGLLFGAVTVGAGWWLENQAKVKAHFADTYYNIGLHVLFWSLLYGLFDEGALSVYTLALALLTAATIRYALRARSLQYFLYGVAYGYVGLSYCIVKLNGLSDIFEAWFLSLYFLISAAALVALIFRYRRGLERDA